VFLVVLSAGLEMKFRDVVDAMRGKGLVVALLGFFIPLAAGIGVGLLFGLDAMRTIFLGLCIAITALPVAIRILESFGLLDSDIARYSIATAIINDVAALLMLGVILNLPTELNYKAVIISVANIGGKLIILAAFVIGISLLLKLTENLGVNIKAGPEKLVKVFGPEALFGIVVVFVLVFGSVSDALGFHFIIGAFFGALLIDRKYFLASRYDDLHKTLGSVTNGFLAPVFFAFLGLELAFSEIDSVWFVIVVLAVSVGSKILAGWLGGRLLKMPQPEALGLGIILNGRGIMELVVASIAFHKGFIDAGLFSVLVLMGVITTLLTPLLFSKLVLPKLGLTAVTPVGNRTQSDDDSRFSS
jgi:Kef-type K+ transport system membrane component KefB